MDHLEYFARDDAYSDVRTDYLYSKERQGIARKARLEWMHISPYSDERYLKLYNKYYAEAVSVELDRARKILDFYNNSHSKPDYPTDCTHCGKSYDVCTEMIFKAGGRACCGVCSYTATHAQDAWERWIRSSGERI